MKKFFIVCILLFTSIGFSSTNVTITINGEQQAVTFSQDLITGQENIIYVDTLDPITGAYGHDFCNIVPIQPIVCNDNDSDGYDDCDGSDGDGLPIDCDDNDDTRSPGITEVCDDEIDNDCDLYVDCDDDDCTCSGEIPQDYVAYYPFDNSGNDMSDNNLDLIWVGIEQYAPGKRSNAALFDNSGYLYRTHDDLLGGMSELTVSLWAKKDYTDEDATLLSKHVHYQIKLKPLYVYPGVWNDSGGGAAWGVTYQYDLVGLNDTEWHNYILIYDGTEVKFYFDSEFISSRSLTGNVDNDPIRNLQIGDNGLQGMIDEVYIYRRALTQNEIDALYNLGITYDVTPPTIESQNYTILSNDSTLVQFTTNEPVIGYVEYCILENCNNQIYSIYSSEQAVMLSGLTSYGTYQYRIIANDEADNQTIGEWNEFTLDDVVIIGRDEIAGYSSVVTQACLDVINSKNILFGSRSWGFYIVNGLTQLNPGMIWDRKYHDAGEYFDNTVYITNNFAHYLNYSWPFNERWIWLDAYARGALQNQIDLGFQSVYALSESYSSALEMFNAYTTQIDQLLIDYPNMNIIVFTHPLDTRESDSIWNSYADEYNSWIIQKYSGIISIFDISNIVSTHSDGTACTWDDDGVIKHKMCSEHNTGDYIHPNAVQIQIDIAKGLLMAMATLYCE